MNKQPVTSEELAAFVAAISENIRAHDAKTFTNPGLIRRVEAIAAIGQHAMAQAGDSYFNLSRLVHWLGQVQLGWI